MSTYYVQWQAYGIATVEAASEEEAGQLASDALSGLDDIDFRTNDVDGWEYEVTADQP